MAFMKLGRRHLTFSLRTSFVVLTALAVWLGVVVNRAREQREAVKAIEELGGIVTYDWQLRILVVGRPQVLGRPGGPAWLRGIIGNDFFQTVESVTFPYMPDSTQADILRTIPHLQRLGGLKNIWVTGSNSQDTADKLMAALPDCENISMSLPGF